MEMAVAILTIVFTAITFAVICLCVEIGILKMKIKKLDEQVDLQKKALFEAIETLITICLMVDEDCRTRRYMHSRYARMMYNHKDVLDIFSTQLRGSQECKGARKNEKNKTIQANNSNITKVFD